MKIKYLSRNFDEQEEEEIYSSTAIIIDIIFNIIISMLFLRWIAVLFVEYLHC